MPIASKARRRTELLARRRTVPMAVRSAEAEQLCGHLGALLDGIRTVCAYFPVGTEPGSTELLDVANRLCPTVLLPVVRTGPSGEHQALHWGRYESGALIAGPYGLREPAEPWLAPSAIAQAQVVLVPALAVDASGVRLGRGGGFYDRSLPLCAAGTRLVAVVRDDELVESLPTDAHDVAMTHALTPGRGLVPLGNGPIADGSSST